MIPRGPKKKKFWGAGEGRKREGLKECQGCICDKGGKREFKESCARGNKNREADKNLQPAEEKETWALNSLGHASWKEVAIPSPPHKVQTGCLGSRSSAARRSGVG